MNQIKQKIKELFQSKGSFANSLNIKIGDLASKMKTVENRINWLNEFLKPLKLKIVIVELEESET